MAFTKKIWTFVVGQKMLLIRHSYRGQSVWWIGFTYNSGRLNKSEHCYVFTVNINALKEVQRMTCRVISICFLACLLALSNCFSFSISSYMYMPPLRWLLWLCTCWISNSFNYECAKINSWILSVLHLIWLIWLGFHTVNVSMQITELLAINGGGFLQKKIYKNHCSISFYFFCLFFVSRQHLQLLPYTSSVKYIVYVCLNLSCVML